MFTKYNFIIANKIVYLLHLEKLCISAVVCLDGDKVAKKYTIIKRVFGNIIPQS